MLGRLSAILTRETTFVIPCLHSCGLFPFWKGVFFLRKGFAPTGSKFFPYKVDPFSEGMQKQWWQLPPMKVYQFPMIHSVNLADDKWVLFKFFFENRAQHFIFIIKENEFYWNYEAICIICQALFIWYLREMDTISGEDNSVRIVFASFILTSCLLSKTLLKNGPLIKERICS